MLTVGEVGAADASSEKGIAAEERAFRRKVEGQGIRRVAGDVENIDGKVSDGDRGFTLEDLVDGKRRDVDRESPFAGALIQDEVGIVVRVAVFFGSNNVGVLDVVKMLVGEEEVIGDEVFTTDEVIDAFGSIEDENSRFCLNKVAVRLNGAAGVGDDFHC